MKANIGKTDKRIRIILGLAAIATGLATGSWWGLAGLILLATAWMHWCPIYTLTGMNTCPRTGKKNGTYGVSGI